MTIGSIHLHVQHLVVCERACQRTYMVSFNEKYQLQLKEEQRILFRVDPKIDLHNFILLGGHVDRGERVIDLLDLEGVIGQKQIFLLNIVELLLELHLSSRVFFSQKF